MFTFFIEIQYETETGMKLHSRMEFLEVTDCINFLEEMGSWFDSNRYTICTVTINKVGRSCS